jgi:hypothetical protein
MKVQEGRVSLVLMAFDRGSLTFMVTDRKRIGRRISAFPGTQGYAASRMRILLFASTSAIASDLVKGILTPPKKINAIIVLRKQ